MSETRTATRTQCAETMTFSISEGGLDSSIELILQEGWVAVVWSIERLGEAFPGGDWLVQNPVLHFEAPGRETISLPLIAGEPSRATICGQRAFRRMRGNAMPKSPLSYTLALPSGDYSVCFTASLYDCRRLVMYCDAMQFFAGDFADMVRHFEENAAYWASKNHVEASEPMRFPCEMELGSISLDKDLVAPPLYHNVNQADVPSVAWQAAPPLLHIPAHPSELQPERYFFQQLQSGIEPMRRDLFCRYGTHCTEAPVPQGNWGTGLRPFAMWGNSFAMHYALTNDSRSGEAASFSARIAHGFLESGPAPHHQHVLHLGIVTMMLLRYARATGADKLLELPAQIWRDWPYDWERHTMATEPDANGKDITANDTYNMKMVGACGLWLLGKHLNDAKLMARGRDCVLHFVLPGLLPQGYWFYRPGSPEGELKNGIQAHNHYDGFVKQLLSRLLMHEEWRAEPGVLDALRRGVDFTLREMSESDGRTLKWELHRGVSYGPRETLARYLGHAGMMCEPLYALATYCDESYLEPLRQSVQYVYDMRDEPLLADYWDNSWFYSVYVGLFSRSQLDVRFEGSVSELRLQPGKAGAICL